MVSSVCRQLFHTLLHNPCIYHSILQFGESQVVPKARLGEIVQATISSLASPDSETVPNQLILVAHGATSDLERLVDLKVSEYIVNFITYTRPKKFTPRTTKQCLGYRHSSIRATTFRRWSPRGYVRCSQQGSPPWDNSFVAKHAPFLKC